MISKKLVAASILAAMGTSAHALDPIKVGDWDLTIAGSVNAFLSNTSCDKSGTGVFTCGGNDDVLNIKNGLLPGFLSFSASTNQKGYDVTGVIAIHPGISNDIVSTTNVDSQSGNETTTITNNRSGDGFQQDLGDVRQVYFSFGNSSMGTVQIGRDFQLFQKMSIFNDMTLLGVGSATPNTLGGNTSLGGIGYGYVYAAPAPQINYSFPTTGGLSATVGLIRGTSTQANISQDSPGVQGLVTYDFGGGKVWLSGASYSSKSNNVDYDTDGVEIGGSMSFGNLGLVASAYSGSGMGIALPTLLGHTTTGQERDSDGYFVQATYQMGDTKLGINHGRSNLDAASGEAAAPIDNFSNVTAGLYHALTPSVTLTFELNRTTEESPAGAKLDNDTVTVGGILFF